MNAELKAEIKAVLALLDDATSAYDMNHAEEVVIEAKDRLRRLLQQGKGDLSQDPIREGLLAIQEECLAPLCASHEYDPTPTAEERLQRIHSTCAFMLAHIAQPHFTLHEAYAFTDELLKP